MEGIETKVMEQREIPTYEECVGALVSHGARLTKGVRNMANDPFSQKVRENRQKMKEIETELERLRYDGRDVKLAGGRGKILTDEERHGVVTGIGSIYLLSRLLKNVMDGHLGRQLKSNAPEAKLVYDFSIRHIELVADLLVAFTDRFAYNARCSGKVDFGIDLDMDKLCTDIDVLNISNTINAFATRFARQIKSQEDEVKEFCDAKMATFEQEKKKLAKELNKMERKHVEN